MRIAGVFLGLVALAGCTTSGSVGNVSTYAATEARLDVCSGYDCPIRETFRLTAADQQRLTAIMKPGAADAAAERVAVRRAIAAMETMARRALRYRRDRGESYQRYSGKRGHMDCVDESQNTRGYLTHLYRSGLLRHHVPQRGYAERGIFVGRFHPHKSAVMRDSAGTDWTVDSWKADDGEPPEVMRLSAWRRDRAPASAYRP